MRQTVSIKVFQDGHWKTVLTGITWGSGDYLMSRFLKDYISWENKAFLDNWVS